MAELLIVVVLAGILTLIALPKYQAAMERTRALEAIENICMLHEYYTIHQALDTNFTMSAEDFEDKIHNKYFQLSGSNGSFEATRNSSSGWSYKITIGGCDGVDCNRLDLPNFNCDTNEEALNPW